MVQLHTVSDVCELLIFLGISACTGCGVYLWKACMRVKKNIFCGSAWCSDRVQFIARSFIIWSTKIYIKKT